MVYTFIVSYYLLIWHHDFYHALIRLWVIAINFLFFFPILLFLQTYQQYILLSYLMWSIDPPDQNQSKQSTTQQELFGRKYTLCIEELRKQNQYKKRALETAESLINSYKKQNQQLKRQNKRMEEVIRSKKEEIKMIRSMLIDRQSDGYSLQVKMGSRESEYESRKIGELGKQIVLLLEDREHLEQKIMKIQRKLFEIEMKSRDKDRTNTLQTQKCEQNRFSGSTKDFQPKNKFLKQKNLTQLRALHMKLKIKQTETDYDHKNKKLCELVTKIFSSEKSRFSTPDRPTQKSTSINRQSANSKKKHQILTDSKRQKSTKKSAKKIFR